MKNSLRRAALAALLGSVVLAGCTDWAGSDLDWAYDYVPWFSKLRRDVSFDPYEMPRLPAPGSVPWATPHGYAPPAFTSLQLDSVAATLTNPVPATPEALARGELVYERQCIVCHGALGAGNGPVVGPNKFPYAPALNSGDATTRSDGYIYAVVRAGRGLMPPYGARMSETERWAVVHYVRKLQGRAPVSVPVRPASAAAPQNVPYVLPPDPSAAETRMIDAGARPSNAFPR